MSRQSTFLLLIILTKQRCRLTCARVILIYINISSSLFILCLYCSFLVSLTSISRSAHKLKMHRKPEKKINNNQRMYNSSNRSEASEPLSE